MAKPTYRSPKYARINLESALEKGKSLMTYAANVPVKEEEIAKYLNYAGLTGRSIAVLSALKKYKILESEKSGLKLTDAAISFFSTGATAVEQSNFVTRAAYAPALFNDLFERFGGQLPDDSEFTEYLTVHNFNPASFGQIIKIFRQNYQLVKHYKNVAISNQGASVLHSNSLPKNSTPQDDNSALPIIENNSVKKLTARESEVPAAPNEVVFFTLSEKVSAKIFLHGTVKQSDIENLIKYLDIYKNNFPSE